MTEPDFSKLPFGLSQVEDVWTSHIGAVDGGMNVVVRLLDGTGYPLGTYFTVARCSSRAEAMMVCSRVRTLVTAAKRLTGKIYYGRT